MNELELALRLQAIQIQTVTKLAADIVKASAENYRLQMELSSKKAEEKFQQELHERLAHGME